MIRIIIIIIIITVLITLFNPDEETPDTFKLIIFYCEKQLKLVTNPLPHKQTECYWPHIMGIAVMQIERRRQGRPGILRLSRKVDAAGNGNLTSIPW